MLDWRGLVSETTSANIFLVIDGALHTPTPEGFLDGITRRTVMSLARRRQMAVVERPIEAAEIALASEVFLAGTTTPPAKLLKHRYATMQRGSHTNRP